MGYYNIKFGHRTRTRLAHDADIRDAYDSARHIDGLGSRAAFMRACHVYADQNPDIPEYLVPQRVAEILNPNLKFRGIDQTKCH